jgi:hypothetical protein
MSNNIIFRRGPFVLTYNPDLADQHPEDTLTGDDQEGTRKGWSFQDILREMISQTGVERSIEYGSPGYDDLIVKYFDLVKAGQLDEVEALLNTEIKPICRPDNPYMRTLEGRIETEREWER